MTDTFFYHLTRQPLDRVLPILLEKTLQRGWRAVVQMATNERLAAIDGALWTYTDESFLAHGTEREGDAELQPVYLTTGLENPNGACARFFIEGTAVLPVLERPDAAIYQRALVLFNGQDPDELASARLQWTVLRDAGHGVTYWQQNDQGGWEKRG